MRETMSTCTFVQVLTSFQHMDIAAANGLTEHLHDLFRWKAEINSAVWKAANEAITKPLMAAITTTPGRPSFTITIKE